ncbi:MAG: AMP-binding protein [Candidatus Coprovivens sp.]
MKFTEELSKTRRIPTYKIEEELSQFEYLDENKPSSRIARTKKGRTAIAGLKRIQRDHNTSWYTELKKRVEDNPNATALFYRGTTVTFKELFERADEAAHSLLAAGVEKGDEIPVCLSNTPELVYILLGANILGVKLNLFSSHFDQEYIKEILDGCSKKMFIGTDDTYGDIEDVVSNQGFEHKVVISLTDSLPQHPELCEGYEPTLAEYYNFPNKTKKFKEKDPSIKTYSEFAKMGLNDNTELIDTNDLDTDFIVTYTSGSTKVGRPKQLLHSNRSFITMGVFHDPELCGNPRMPGFRALAHIHTDSNTNLITSISDSLMQQWSVALEPEYSKEKALDYLLINKANQVSMTTSFWVHAAKQYLIDKRHHENGKGRKLPFLFAGLSVGEITSKGEEKFINKFLREAKAGSGVKIKGLSLPFTSIGFGGGDCEHGGLYYTLWHNLYEKLNYLKLQKREYGMAPVPFAQVSAFKQVGPNEYVECNYNEYGLIAANSAVSLKCYQNNPEATKQLIIRDEHGRDWISSNVYGYIDNLGNVHVKGRIGAEIVLQDGTILLPFMIEETVEQDTKNVLSCSLSRTMNNEFVLNIEFQPFSKKNEEQILLSIKERLLAKYPSIAELNILIRIMSLEESFPLTGSGKRNFRALENMPIEDTISLEEIGKKKSYTKTKS